MARNHSQPFDLGVVAVVVVVALEIVDIVVFVVECYRCSIRKMISLLLLWLFAYNSVETKLAIAVVLMVGWRVKNVRRMWRRVNFSCPSCTVTEEEPQP